MALYTVHLPKNAARGSREGLERAVLVKDGFRWLAFVFPLLWPLFNRLWIVFLAMACLVLGIGLAGRWLEAPEWAIGAVELLLAIAMGVCASELKTWTLSREGMPAVDVVTGVDEEDAERRFFARWLAGASQAPVRGPMQPAPFFPPPGPQHVTGLFPEPGRGRA